ncbi:MAG: FAD-containing oxidoreductase [Planctomycetes bacterium]|nr:FAD-containing oxidoreductase [Planctomycetota bacterium]
MQDTVQQIEPEAKGRRRASRLRLAGLLVLIAGSVAAVLLFPVKDFLQSFLQWVRDVGFWGPAVLGLVYVLCTVLFVPGSILTAGSGFAFGLVTGTLTAVVASNLGAGIAFMLGRTLARGWIETRVAGNPKFQALDEALGAQGFKIVLLTRLSPAFPFNFLNYAFGVTRVRFRDYLVGSLIGMFPGTLMYVYLGSAVKSVTEIATGEMEGGVAQKILFVVGLLATIVVTLLVTRLARKALSRVAAQSPQSTDAQAEEKEKGMTLSVQVLPDDPYNRTLVSRVHPPSWENPEPSSRYNLVVIGAGTAGLVSAAGAAGLGAKVALVEKHLMGGDCLNYGCVPSKALLRVARSVAAVREAGEFGVRVPAGWRVEFPAVMDRIRRLRAEISPHDSAVRFQSLGIDVFFGTARFAAADAIDVGGQTLRFSRAVIATGARAASLSIPGLNEADYLTNETVFSLTELPRRLAVVGAGPIGCELSQAFARFGAKVWLLQSGSHVLRREDPDAARIVQDALLRDGVELIVNCRVQEVQARDGEKRLILETGGERREIAVDAILAGVGRAPNVEGLNLEAAGIEYDKNGVKVDDALRTTNPRVFAAGDICFPYKFTHVADAMARIVIQNALFSGRAKASTITIPWCTYTDPEIAHVGLYEKEAQERGLRVRTFVQDLSEVDRAVLDGDTEGFVKVHVREGTDQILGATIVARHAGELISELTLAMTAGVGLKSIAKTIHPYPTQAEGIKKVADAYNRTRLTPFVKWLFAKWLSWRR